MTSTFDLRSLVSSASLALCTASSLGWLLSLIMPYSMPHYFGFAPANVTVGHFYMWTVVTQLFAENNLFSLVVGGLITLVCFSRAEASIGLQRLALFIAVCTTLSSMLLIVISAVVFRLFGSLWLYMTFGGFMPAAMVVSVVLAHVTRGGDSVVAIPSYQSSLRTKHVPFAIFLMAFAWDVWSHVVIPAGDVMTELDIGSTDETFTGPAVPMVVLNFMLAWGIIRFHGVSWLGTSHNDEAFMGGPDSTAAFAMHEFVFPHVLQVFALRITTSIFSVYRSMGYGRDIDKAWQHSLETHQSIREASVDVWMPQPHVSSDNRTGATSSLQPLPGTTIQDAERRRAVALAALTARLHQAQLRETNPAVRVAQSSMDELSLNAGSPSSHGESDVEVIAA